MEKETKQKNQKNNQENASPFSSSHKKAHKVQSMMDATWPNYFFFVHYFQERKKNKRKPSQKQ